MRLYCLFYKTLEFITQFLVIALSVNPGASSISNKPGTLKVQNNPVGSNKSFDKSRRTPKGKIQKIRIRKLFPICLGIGLENRLREGVIISPVKKPGPIQGVLTGNYQGGIFRNKIFQGTFDHPIPFGFKIDAVMIFP